MKTEGDEDTIGSFGVVHFVHEDSACFGGDTFDRGKVLHVGWRHGQLLDETVAHIHSRVALVSKPDILL